MFETENTDEDLEFNLDDFDNDDDNEPENNPEPGKEIKEDLETEVDEVENLQSETDTNAQEQDSVIDKFKNEDGTVNHEAISQLLQEKTELEQKAQAAEQLKEERENFAKNLGYANYEKMQEHQKKLMSDMQFAKFEANEYSRYLQYSSNPENTRGLLIQYAQNPSIELQAQIESEFDINVIKKVNQDLEKFKFEVDQENKQEEYNTHQKEAREFVTDAVTRYKDKFESEPFKELFGECIKFAGNRFDIDHLVKIASSIEESAVNKYIAEQAKLKENNQATNNLEVSTPQSKKVESVNLNSDINKMSSSEIDKLVQTLI